MAGSGIGNIVDASFTTEMSDRYLAYALSATMARALPDVRDGLKPVHRRIIFAMRQLKLDPGSGFKKCARVVGDVMGKFHPHGDMAIYEAMVRLAQDFASRYPLVEGQGNFGNIDGDNAAAMRYTESRMSAFATALLDGINEDTVAFKPTYDNEDEEPVVLPASLPNLLANGSSGIAVGMATSIPPHNIRELCNAARALIANPAVDVQDLLKIIPAPDFPTGATIVDDQEALLTAYETGRGSIRMRAVWEVEQRGNGTWQVVITEIPYQTNKATLIASIAELVVSRRLPLVDDIRDESSDRIRITIMPKSRSVDPEMMMAGLFKLSGLESRFSFNMNVVDANNVPRVMGLKDLLQGWLDHRHVVLVRRSRHRLAAIARRLEILDGYLAVFANLDEVIRIIREEDDPRQELITTFSLTGTQADAILDMRLRSLRKLDEMALREEHASLEGEQAGLKDLLADDAAIWGRVSDDIGRAAEKFGDDRRTRLIGAEAVDIEIPTAATVEKEPVTVILSSMGWIKAAKGHAVSEDSMKFKDGDALDRVCMCQTTDRLMLFGSNGKSYTIPVANLPRGRGDGQALRLMIDLDNDSSVIAMAVSEPAQEFLLARADGKGFVTSGANMVAEKRTGRQVINTEQDLPATHCLTLNGSHVALLGDNRKLLVIDAGTIPRIQRGAGATLQKYKTGGLLAAQVISPDVGIRWSLNGETVVDKSAGDWIAGRATQGKAPPKPFMKAGTFVAG